MSNNPDLLSHLLEHGTGERRVKPRPARTPFDVAMHAVVVAVGEAGEVAIVAANSFDGRLIVKATPGGNSPRVQRMLAEEALPVEGIANRIVFIAAPATDTPASRAVIGFLEALPDARYVETFSAAEIDAAGEEVADLVTLGLMEPTPGDDADLSDIAARALDLAFALAVGYAPELPLLPDARRNEATAARARAAELRKLAAEARAPIPSRFAGEKPGRAHRYTRRSGDVLAREIDKGRRAAEAAETALVGGILAGMAVATNSEQ